MTLETAAWTALAAPLIAMALAVTVIGILGCVAIRKAPPGDVPKVLTALAAVIRAFRGLVPRSRPAGATVVPAPRTAAPLTTPTTVVAGDLPQSAPATDTQ